MSCYSGDIDTGSDCYSNWSCNNDASCDDGRFYRHVYDRCLNTTTGTYCNYTGTETSGCCNP